MSVLQTARTAARAGVRHAALSAMAAWERRGGAQEKALARPRVHFPYLHAVPPEEEADFRRLLRSLSDSHGLISYSEAVRRVLEDDIDRPYVAFSFDDGFASNVRTAAILEEFGAVGCFFVTTAFVGTRTVAEARALFGYSEGIDEPAMTWSDLERLKGRGHEIGNHTHTHRRLSALSSGQVAEEIHRGSEMVRRRLGGVDHFAWPFGRFAHFTAEAADLVFDDGHVSCASAERGAHVPGGAPVAPRSLCLRRDHLMTSWPASHLRYFLAASAGRAQASDNEWPAEFARPR